MRLTLAIAATLLVTACSSGTPATVTQPAATQAPPAATQAATLTKAQAAAAYTAAVTPGNKLGEQYNAETKRASPRMDRVRAIGKQMQAAHRTFLEVLTSTVWPANVQTDMDAVAKEVGAMITWDGQVAKAKTMSDIPPVPPDGGSAQLVRAKLGLPVVPG